MNKLLAAALLLCPVAAANAATTYTYTDETAFLSQVVPGYYLEDFDSYTYGVPLNGTGTSQQASFSDLSGFSYTAFAVNNLWSNDGAISTNNASDDLVFTFDGLPVTAVGAIVSATDVNGDTIVGGNVDVQLSDGTTFTILTSEFVGFTSTAPISTITFTGFQAGESNWPQIDHVFVGTAVPEPAALGVLLAASGLLIQRKRQRAR